MDSFVTYRRPARLHELRRAHVAVRGTCHLYLTISRVLKLMFATFCVASAVSFATYYWFLRNATANTDLVEAVGELQARANRVHWILNRVHLEAKDLEYLRNAVPAIRAAIRALDQGGVAFGRQVPPIREEFSAKKQEVRQRWEALEADLSAIAALPDPRTADALPDTRLHPRINQFEAQVRALLEPLENQRQALRQRIVQVLIAFTGISLLLLLASATVVTRRVVRPIQSLIAATEAIRRGDFKHRVPALFEDELGALRRSFNEMAEIVQRFVEQLMQSEARLAEAQRIAHVGNWEVDLQTETLHWSAEVHRIYGIERKEGRLARKVFWDAVHPDDVELVRATSQRSISTGEAFAVEHRIVRPDGNVRVVREHAEMVRGDTGRTIRMVGTVQDITEQKQIEEQLHQARKMEAIGLLASGVAHDFNNLLTVINGYGALLLEFHRIDDGVRKGIQSILAAGEKATALTQQLLTFGRKQVLQRRIVSLNEVAINIKPMLSRIIREDIELEMVLRDDLYPVRADLHQIEQVLMNLVINSRDAMPQGGRITIETQNIQFDQSYCSRHIGAVPGPHAMLAVADTGIGMDEQVKSRIFEPFFTTKEQGKGTGLGLPTVFGIVSQSGGHISVYSEPGQGTTFKLYFPVACQSDTADAEEGAKSQAASPRGTETILLVEDNQEVRQFAAEVLSSLGYTVLLAIDGHDARALADSHRGTIHLLLTDVVLPKIGGRQLAEEISRRRPEVKVMYISGYAEHAAPSDGIGNASVFYLPKPFTPYALAKKVREVLDDAGLAAVAPKPPRRVLVVDDDALIRDLFAQVLRRAGYDVRCAASGDEALIRLREIHVDLVVLDLMMPGQKDGETVLAVKREFPHVHTIVVSGLPGDSFNADLLGVDRALLKPVSPEILVQEVGSVLA